jgi:rare lipoprotein A
VARVFAGISAPARVALGLAILISLSLAIAACGDKGPRLGKRVIPLGQPVPKGGGRYHVGEPYQIGGQWYRPREQPGYDKTGQASWYGALFHGRYTANGEIYDMDRLSAAHPTLPLPVYVHVTNLRNGRSIIVRVNDRGPFKNNRIIDLSRRSAEVLGFRGSGTAPVRVRYMRRAPLSGDDSYERQYLASRGYRRYASKDKATSTVGHPFAVASIPGGSAPPLPDRPVRPVAALSPPEPVVPPDRGLAAASWRKELKGSSEATGSLGSQASPVRSPLQRGPLIQAGSFKNRDNAERARTALSAVAPVDVVEVDVGGEVYFRVRVGPFADAIDAAAALPRVTDAGYDGAKIVMQN